MALYKINLINNSFLKWILQLSKFYCSFDIFSILITPNNNSIIQKIISIFKKQEKELKNLTPVVENIEIIKNLVSQDKRVIIISHGKYSSDYIRKILIQFDNVFKNIRIYTSSSYSKQKHYKNLYKVISIAENIDYQNWFHLGNSRYLDIIVPSKFGINVNL